MESKTISLRKYRKTDKIVSDVLLYCRYNLKTLLLPLIKVLLPFILIKSALDAYLLTINKTDPSGDIVQYLWGSTSYLFSSLFGSLLINLFIVIAVVQSDKNGETTPGEIVSESIKKFLPFLFISVLATFAAFIGFFIFIVPFFLVLIVYFYAVVDHQYEGNSIFDSVGNVRVLLKGNYFKAFILMLSLSVIVFLLSWIFQLPETIITIALGIHTFESGEPSVGYLLKYLFVILQHLTAIGNLLLWIGIAMHYFSLKEQKFGNSLFEKIDSAIKPE